MVSSSLTIEMAGGETIKLFKFTRKAYQGIGIDPPESNRSRSAINAKNYFFFLCQVEYFITTAAYLLFEANSMIEFGMTFFTCTTVITVIALYSILLGRMKNILNYIENCNRFIAKSEYRALYKELSLNKAKTEYEIDELIHLRLCVCVAGTHSTIIYKETNEKIERLTELFAYVLTFTFIILVLPFLLYAMVSYYILGLGAKSFFLFCPTWFVLTYNEMMNSD